jgi:hypothetical protein
MEFPWFTVELLLLLTVDRLPSHTLTPFPTELSVALTTSTPLAPSNAVPARLTEEFDDVVTDELLVAIAPPAGSVMVAPAVTLSIWVSLIACALVCLVGAWVCPYATPRVSAEAVNKTQRVLFTMFLRYRFILGRARSHAPSGQVGATTKLTWHCEPIVLDRPRTDLQTALWVGRRRRQCSPD